MSCKADPRKRQVALALLRRLRRILQIQREQAGQLNKRGVLLLTKSIFATFLDLTDLGHKKAAWWYIVTMRELDVFEDKKTARLRMGPRLLMLFFPMRTTKAPNEYTQQLQEPRIPKKYKSVIEQFEDALRLYQEAKNMKSGLVRRADGQTVFLNEDEVRSLRQKALKKVRLIGERMILEDLSEQAGEILESYGLTWEDILR